MPCKTNKQIVDLSLGAGDRIEVAVSADGAGGTYVVGVKKKKTKEEKVLLDPPETEAEWPQGGDPAPGAYSVVFGAVFVRATKYTYLAVLKRGSGEEVVVKDCSWKESDGNSPRSEFTVRVAP